MVLSPGTRLGPYEISGRLGAGGMGDVYRARDTRLDRSVAIKICAQEFSERFESEARAISSLNHPNICTLHDVGPNYLVMELVEGPTLAQRIADGPIPLAEALPVARQIAEALEAAHGKGIIHRDLKPANVKLTSEGQVKVLDFGLAKMTQAALKGSANVAESPTLSMEMTRAGMILGTAAYMPPEQARGETVDKRADIWAFGCLLYEMLTGKKTFSGGSLTDVLAAVIGAEPDWSALPASTPSSIRRLLKRCLEKDRKRRLPDIGVAKLEIDDANAAPSEPRPSRSGLPLIAALVALAVVAAVAAAVWRNWSAPAQEAWSGVILGGPTSAFAPRLSPDGQLLAFQAFLDDLPQLGVMKPDGGSWTILTRDREAGYVATTSWAPDGSRIYFDRYWGHPRGIYSVAPLGGEPRTVLEDAYGPEPLRDGSLIVAKVTDLSDHQLFHFWPDSGRLEALPAFISARDVSPVLRAFPDGKEIVYFGANGQSGRTQSPRMYVMDLRSKHVRELAPGIDISVDNWCPLAISPDGNWIFVLGAAGDSRLLMKIPRRGGTPPRVLLSFPASAAPPNFDVARDGTLYLDHMPASFAALWFSAAGGTPQEVPIARFENLAILPTGEVLSTLFASGKLHLASLIPGKEPSPLFDTPEESSTPAVALAGGNLVFVSGSGDNRRMAIASRRDGRILRRFAANAADVTSICATPDATKIYYSSGGAIWEQTVSGGNPRRIADGSDATLDPGGRYLYVKRNRATSNDLFRIPLAGGEPEKLFIPADYHLAFQPLSAAAVDGRGRILFTVISSHSFYYSAAILDPSNKSFTVLPVAFHGDVARAGWNPDGRIAAVGGRYVGSLWRYRLTNASH